jgi:uncharacterized protein (DUF302 family)
LTTINHTYVYTPSAFGWVSEDLITASANGQQTVTLETEYKAVIEEVAPKIRQALMKAVRAFETPKPADSK